MEPKDRPRRGSGLRQRRLAPGFRTIPSHAPKFGEGHLNPLSGAVPGEGQAVSYAERLSAPFFARAA